MDSHYFYMRYNETARQALPTPQSGPNRNGSHEDRVMAKRQPTPTLDILSTLYSYDPETGLFRMLPRAGKSEEWHKRYAGKIAGGRNAQGYVTLWVGERLMYAHRLAFIYMGETVPEIVDHINGCKSDNRWLNLRPATHKQNCRNLTPRQNASGFHGVWRTKSSKFVAQIRVDNFGIKLGRFETVEEAVAARRKAEERYGFTRAWDF